MLARKFRLPASQLLKNSHVIREDIFTVRFQKNEFQYDRFGFVVAKSIDKRAVIRNSLKRMVRAHIEATWAKEGKGTDVLFVLRPAIKTAEKEVIFQKVDEVMKKAQY